MGILDFLGLRKMPKPQVPKSPKPQVRKVPKPPMEDREARKAARIEIAKKKAAHLPDSLDSPFFHDLRRRWDQTPTLAAPVSQLCTTDQFGEEDYARLCNLLQTQPSLRRKQWEFIYVLRALEIGGCIEPDKRGLVFGVGKEKLPSLLAANGCYITATDLPMAEADGHWAGGPQHAATLDALCWLHLVERDTFKERVEFRPVNMKAIPDDLQGYDFCWSSCALEHLGGLEEGFDFIRKSLTCLRLGGLAVHTTEFNLGSATETLTTGGTVVYREQDILRFAEEMRDEGHQIELNLAPGDAPTDLMINRFHDSDIHLRLYVMHQVPATSIGLTVRKAL